MIICWSKMIKCWSKVIKREEILNFTPINHFLQPDYLGVGTTEVESGGGGEEPVVFLVCQKYF